MPTFTASATLCPLWKTRLLGDLLNRLFQFGIFGILCYPVVYWTVLLNLQRTVPDTMICPADFNVFYNRYWDINVLYLNNKKAFQWDAYRPLFDCSGGVWVQGVVTHPPGHNPWSHPLITHPSHSPWSHLGYTPPCPMECWDKSPPPREQTDTCKNITYPQLQLLLVYTNSNCVKGEFTHTTSLKSNFPELWRFSL